MTKQRKLKQASSNQTNAKQQNKNIKQESRTNKQKT